ncbi:MAG: CoxG family protein, partial [Candidatus Puniceispirillaceae bacterium]
MQLNQSHDIPVPVQTVWTALNDAEILAQAIPGCEMLEKN